MERLPGLGKLLKKAGIMIRKYCDFCEKETTAIFQVTLNFCGLSKAIEGISSGVGFIACPECVGDLRKQMKKLIKKK